MKEPLYSITLYKSGDVAMTVYQGKTKKNVAILSILHQNITIADNAKKTPESVKAYKDTKYGVDIVDQMERKYTFGTSTRIWLIHSFQNTLDLAAINAWIVYQEVTTQLVLTAGIQVRSKDPRLQGINLHPDEQPSLISQSQEGNPVYL